MAAHDFLDRTDGLEHLSKFLSLHAPTKRLLLVSGARGVGKTSLINHAAKRQENWLYVKVDRASPQDALVPRPSLTMAIADELERQSAIEGFRPRRLMMQDLARNRRASFETTASALSKLTNIVGSFKEVRDRFKQNTSPIEDFKEIDKIYIRDLLQQHQCLVHIDHGHHCLKIDLEFIAFLIETTHSIFVIEHDEDVTVEPPLNEVCVNRINIPRLDMQYAKRLFDQFPAGLNESLMADFRKNGSLLPYRDIFARRTTLGRQNHSYINLTDGIYQLTKKSVFSLNDIDRQSLIAISAHVGEPISIGLLKKFLLRQTTVASSDIDIHSIIRRLDEAVLIVSTTTDVQASSFADTIIAKEPKYASNLIIYKKAWRDFYRSASDAGFSMPIERLWLQIIRQCVELDVVAKKVVQPLPGCLSAEC